ncbi:MAG: ASCH domain-containing protein, partial [Sphaerochaeta sp.]|nr:ASCH domain-containing protein [Sphaerochaeta sp.]
MPETEPKRMPFSPALVPKVLDGTKTVTRRCHRTPRYKVGDIICISERWQHEDTSCDDPQCG